ncbi:hypothetical protein L2617_10795 [Acinetobacter baumannii]|uniref:hypothetical protein n=1 Tax=Acinetobacter baumannii TaxID=470 RepID=UPI001BD05E82|nr:hypothetical protein [Acinetobacter baumannii]MBS4735871.1 hypothetical protein [Acinetobacter baumannii]MCH1774014.1 hypothetical protein [Acinetobacter baumannii]MCR0003896.1 hypothetical protein [Acinetobacter baumannii]
MDNYKIKVTDEAESKEAQELFVQLGYKLDTFFGNYEPSTRWVLACADGSMGCASDGMAKETLKELTLPQLRDLVVLKRNDVKDANCIDKKCEAWYLASDGTYYAWQYRKLCWDTESDACVEAHDIKPIQKQRTQDQGLISGADVPSLIKKGESVQFRSKFNVQGGGDWQDLNLERDEEEFSLGDLINTRFEWRLKPQTIKLELEIPAPFEPKDGDRCFCPDMEQDDGFLDFHYSEDSGFHKNFTQFGAWRTEEEIKQVVGQLRKLRGNNS